MQQGHETWLHVADSSGKQKKTQTAFTLIAVDKILSSVYVTYCRLLTRCVGDGVHVILVILQLWEQGFSTCGTTVCCSFYNWSEAEVVQTKSLCKAPTLAPSNNQLKFLLHWNGYDCTFSTCDKIEFYYDLKFDWYCQHSSSRSNSLNSCKLPGRFSYSLGMRLWHP